MPPPGTEEAEKKAKEETELRKAKEIEEEESRLREKQQREHAQKEIQKLMAAHDDALRMAKEEAEKREQKELEEQARRKLEEEEKERMLKEFAELQAVSRTNRTKCLTGRREESSYRGRSERSKPGPQEELEESLTALEGLLEEEKQAKRDEEIVRGLQARLLDEETEKREELEKLKEEQERMLQEEQEKRQHLELVSEELQMERLEQQRLLERERERLEILERDRKSADEQLQEAIEKLMAAEQKKKDEEKRRQELQRPVGLARLIQPKANPLKSHRGVGAFTESQFDVIKQLRRQWKDRSILSPTDDLPNGPPDHEGGQMEVINKIPTQGDVEVNTNGQVEEQVDEHRAAEGREEHKEKIEENMPDGEEVAVVVEEASNGASTELDGGKKRRFPRVIRSPAWPDVVDVRR
ncbi:hypothetical protein BSL78_01735 [Apostichopus japonicus]|uniref:Uncharacterized protein n=1 Tax=Stichopus japonicus TaxID=307972 RepID=A0A2G8LM51_STIJA|nr:hypothetical protein BSL78_01735 [Apostichopus japonicus]